MNTVNLIGRLTQDPQVATRSDTTICKLRVAVNRLPGKNGEDRGANYFDIATFGGLALNCGKYLTKGRRVGIAGRLNHTEAEGPQNTKFAPTPGAPDPANRQRPPPAGRDRVLINPQRRRDARANERPASRSLRQ